MIAGTPRVLPELSARRENEGFRIMQRELPRFGQACVLVIGDIMLDRYWEEAKRK